MLICISLRTFWTILIGLLIFVWISRIVWPKMGSFGGKRGKGWCNVDPNKLVFTFGVFYACEFWWKSTKKCEHESVQTWIQWHTQMQTSFITCPMPYAIAMGQISLSQRGLKSLTVIPGFQSQRTVPILFGYISTQAACLHPEVLRCLLIYRTRWAGGRHTSEPETLVNIT